MNPALVLKLNTAVFFFTSFSCYQGARLGYPWLGVVVFAIHAALFLPSTSAWKKRTLIALMVAITGFVADSALIKLGVYSVKESSRWLIPDPWCPDWILVLWLNFGFMLFIFWHFLAKGRWTATIVGIVFAFLIMGNASRMELIVFRPPIIYGYLIISACWAILVPFFTYCSIRCFGENNALS